MYLNQLDKEKQKLFLDLSIHASLTNDDFSKEEKNAVDSYCIEMGLPKSDYHAEKNLDTVLDELKNKCSEKELNIILIEITALIMSDSVYDTLEQKFMKHLQDELNFSNEKIENIIFAINQLMKAYSMLNKII